MASRSFSAAHALRVTGVQDETVEGIGFFSIWAGRLTQPHLTSDSEPERLEKKRVERLNRKKKKKADSLARSGSSDASTRVLTEGRPVTTASHGFKAVTIQITNEDGKSVFDGFGCMHVNNKVILD